MNCWIFFKFWFGFDKNNLFLCLIELKNWVLLFFLTKNYKFFDNISTNHISKSYLKDFWLKKKKFFENLTPLWQTWLLPLQSVPSDLNDPDVAFGHTAEVPVHLISFRHEPLAWHTVPLVLNLLVVGSQHKPWLGSHKQPAAVFNWHELVQHPLPVELPESHCSPDSITPLPQIADVNALNWQKKTTF